MWGGASQVIDVTLVGLLVEAMSSSPSLSLGPVSSSVASTKHHEILGGSGSVGEYLPNMCKVLDSYPPMKTKRYRVTLSGAVSSSMRRYVLCVTEDLKTQACLPKNPDYSKQTGKRLTHRIFTIRNARKLVKNYF